MQTMTYEGSYRDRDERQKFAIANFPRAFKQDALLDVGGGENRLLNHLQETSFTGNYWSVDLFAQPTVKADLNRDPLPFGPDSVGTVVCLDVLEHLDRIHQRFRQLLEVARKFVLLSLPNSINWLNRLKILEGETVSGKYGLPTDAPDDRHRWFFSYSQARKFVHSTIEDTPYRIIREFPCRYRFNRLSARILDWCFARFGSPDLYAWAYWCLLEVDS